jgi:DoxX-like family
MRTRTIAYWATTLIVAAELVSGGVLDLARTGSTVATLHHLGYPTYLLSILGPWRLLAAAALLAPGLPRLKEWAYAGTFFELTGAALSFAAVGGSTGNVVTPLLLAACAVASWALRPPSRTLGVLSLPGVHVGRGSNGPAR